MEIQGLYWVILLLGGLQGLVLGTMLMISPKGHPMTKKFLVLLLLLSSYTLFIEFLRSSLISMEDWGYYLLIDLHWAYGPLLYALARSFLNPSFRIKGKQWPIFIPVGMQITVHAWVKIQNLYWEGSPSDLPFMGSESYQLWLHTPFPFLILFGLLLISIASIQPILRNTYARALNHHQKAGLNWLNGILWAFMLFSLLGMGITMVDFIFFDYAFAPFYPYPIFIGLAVLTYGLAMSGYAHREATLPPLDLPLASGESSPHPRAGTMETLHHFFNEQKPYLDPEMTLVKLAGLMDTKGYLLTKALNQVQGMTFSQYLNAFRMQEAKRLLLDPKFKDFTLLAIGFEAGFNSKASFNRIFKASTGIPPGVFRKNPPQ